MAENPENYELLHYGVKGMRWGVRRPVNSSTGLVSKGSPTKPKKPPKHPKVEEAKTARSARKQTRIYGTDTMTNEELKRAVNRMQLEQNYARLVDDRRASSRRMNAGQRAAVGIVTEFGLDVAKDVAKDTISGIVKSAIESKLKK